MERTHRFGFVLVAHFVIPFYFAFSRHTVLELRDTDVAEAVDLAEN